MMGVVRGDCGFCEACEADRLARDQPEKCDRALGGQKILHDHGKRGFSEQISMIAKECASMTGGRLGD